MKLAGTRKRPTVWAECEFVDTKDRKNSSGVITVGDVDGSLRVAEIYSSEHITRDMAIQKLKEAKDLLDISILTQEQFDAEKARYMPYVTPVSTGAAP